MTIRKFSRELLESEPHGVLFRDLYPWDAIDDTPFGASLALVQPGGRTMLHSHDPAETFVICRGQGTISIDQEATAVGPGDVIYLPPGSIHDLRNDSATDELVFVSVFWKSRVDSRLGTAPRLLVPSPPTPNGPLHLGHLAGPYLLADVTRRYLAMRGIAAQLVCLTDDHQSYVADRAHAEGQTPGELAARFGAEIDRAFERFLAVPDIRIATSRDDAYQTAVRERFAALLAAGKLEARDGEVLHCEACDLSLYDSYVAGECPRCRAASFGFVCEACNEPFDSTELLDPRCDRCKQPVVDPAVVRFGPGPQAVRRKATRLFFPIAPYRDALREYHRRLRLAPKLRKLAAQWLERDFAPAASQVGTWGIPVPDERFAGQIISPWFEIALAGAHLRERCGRDAEMQCFFGYDNAYLYLIQDPAATLALDPDAKLPTELAANEFLLLDDAKMSTSRGHRLDANAVLERVPADLIRLYLAKVRPEDARASTSIATAQMFLTMVSQHWQFGWLWRLAAKVAERGGTAPAPANASLAPWSREQQAFLNALNALVVRARDGYDACSLKEPTSAIFELVERASAFGIAQDNLAGVPSLESQRDTAIALELAAARTLAMLAAPIMPAFAVQLWQYLGETGPIAWIDDVYPLPAGQAIAPRHGTATPQFFPLQIVLA